MYVRVARCLPRPYGLGLFSNYADRQIARAVGGRFAFLSFGSSLFGCGEAEFLGMEGGRTVENADRRIPCACSTNEDHSRRSTIYLREPFVLIQSLY